MKRSTSKKQAKFEGDISVCVVNFFYGTMQDGKDRAAFVWLSSPSFPKDSLVALEGLEKCMEKSLNVAGN